MSFPILFHSLFFSSSFYQFLSSILFLFSLFCIIFFLFMSFPYILCLSLFFFIVSSYLLYSVFNFFSLLHYPFSILTVCLSFHLSHLYVFLKSSFLHVAHRTHEGQTKAQRLISSLSSLA
uniref:Uncharacterized protein n=1 Tax=Cacopsylla melanoneura TaxID=428564 RepID=A0A8D9BD66_9HEMI